MDWVSPRIAFPTLGCVAPISQSLPDFHIAGRAYNPRMSEIKVWTTSGSDKEPSLELQTAIHAAIGRRSGFWDVFFLDIDATGDFKIIIDGPDGFHWSRKFLGPDEHAAD